MNKLATLTGVTLAALLLAIACDGGDSSPTPSPAPSPAVALPSPTPTTTPIPTPAPAPRILLVEWDDILGPTTAPPGWSVSGDSSCLGVLADKEYLGAAELGVDPLESLPDFRALLDTSPDELSALKALVTDHYRVIEEDRRIGFGEGYMFRPLEPEEVSVGGLRGLRSDFSGLDASGRLLERSVAYWAFDGDLMYLIVANAVDVPHDCGFTHESLEIFEPFLAEIVENLRLPASTTTP